MRYWDSSALIPLICGQKSTSALRELYQHDAEVLSWTLSETECLSALSRLVRERAIAADEWSAACGQLAGLWQGVHQVSLVDAVKTRAKRVLRLHPLKAADALQLGAALAAVYDDPAGWEFVCLDDRLRQAAEIEGFTVLP